MSCELQVVHGVKTTLVDPRPFKFSRVQRTDFKTRGITATVQYESLTPMNQAADHTRGRLSGNDEADPSACSDVLIDSMGAVTNPCESRRMSAAGTDNSVGLAGMAHPACNVSADTSVMDPAALAGADAASGSNEQDAPQIVFHQLQGLFEKQLWQSSRWKDLLSNCSVVIGMHPDQATEPILQFALQSGKALAVVPCCVFPRQFPNRTILNLNGEQQGVTQYAELLDYLLQQSSGQKQALPFEGANQVVFRTSICQSY